MTLPPEQVRAVETAASLIEIDATLIEENRDAWLEARSRAEINTLNAIPREEL